MEKIFDIFIRATPEEVWEAVTERQGEFNFRVPEELQGGFASGATVEREAPRRLAQTMKATWSPEVEQEPESRITWEIAPWERDVTHLRITHGELREGANDQLYGGWPMILSSLKSLLETGESLNLEIPAEALERMRAGAAS